MTTLPIPFDHFSAVPAAALRRLPDRRSAKKHPARRGIFLLLLVVMLAGAVLSPSSVRAEGSGITLGSGAITTENKVYFGTWNNKPVLWRVMGTGNAGSGMLLLSEYLLDQVKFYDKPPYSNIWQGSTAQGWCGTFYSDHLTEEEKLAVIVTSKTDPAYEGKYENFGSFELKNENVFFLS